MTIWYGWVDAGSATTSDCSTWTTWATETDSASTNYVTSNDATDTWMCWAGGTTAGTDDTWISWATDLSVAGNTWTTAPMVVQDAEVLAAAWAEQTRRREEWTRQEEERKQKRKEADERAEELLRVELTESQLATLEAQSAFLVESEEGRRYRVRRRRVVEELDENGEVVATYCIHSQMLIPAADTMLAQKLMLEVDEAAFRRIGNRSEVRH